MLWPDDPVDIYNEDGTKSGRTEKLDSVAHTQGLWHKTVHVWIINKNNDFLLQQRSKFMHAYPNMWDTPAAGHLDLGKEPIEMAIQETEEEIGIKLDLREFRYLFTHKDERILNDGKFINRELVDVYLVRKDFDINDLKLQRREVAAVKWVSFDNLKKMITERDPELVPNYEEYEKVFKSIE